MLPWCRTPTQGRMRGASGSKAPGEALTTDGSTEHTATKISQETLTPSTQAHREEAIIWEAIDGFAVIPSPQRKAV